MKVTFHFFKQNQSNIDKVKNKVDKLKKNSLILLIKKL